MLIALAGCSDAGVDEWRLPAGLREVSGLAADAEGRLFTVTDEKAIVYEFDLNSGEIRTVLLVGEPAADDFEGIEVVNNDVYLINSKGMLYYVPNGLLAGNMPNGRYTVIDTGLEEVCEVEGLGRDADSLLIACKNNYRQEDEDHLLVFAWSLTDGGPVRPMLRVPGEFNASGIAVDKDDYYVVSAKQKRLMVLDRNGAIVDVRKLESHRQAEGVALLPSGEIIIADEGNNKGGRIRRYRSVSDIPE